MRIAHISDIHIRNLKFHAEYKRVFADFCQKLRDLKVDLVVNTGDTAHTKTNISPEFVDMATRLLTDVAEVCPIVNILGNHDLNLMNEDRQDAISPIIDALNDPRIVLLKKAGKWVPPPEWGTAFIDNKLIAFQNLAIADPENWPRAPFNDDYINIGLFHGAVMNCITDSLFRMTHTEYNNEIFEGLDFVMMGDIHKRQSFQDGRVWYAGSMIQQNFGEDPEKGFLMWDIKSKDEWRVEFVELKGSRKFFTLRLHDDLKIPDLVIEPDSRIRIAPPRALTLVEQKTVEKLVKRKYVPHDVITLGVSNISQMTATVSGKDLKVENLRDVTVQEQLLRGFLGDKKLKEDVVNKVVDMNRRYQNIVEQKEDMARGVNWRVLKLGWNNLYNYGEGNVIDFSQIKGLTGIFAPNASGKSGMIDAITIGMFDANTKEVTKNIHLVNDNKDKAAVIVELLANGERYTVQREIERIKFARKGEAQEWGKTTLDFQRHDKDGGVEKLVMESRPDTERQIRRRFGTFEDFMLTSLFAQWDPMDIIMCKETDRKRILYRFLDLDIFEEKAKLAREDSKVWLDKLADLEEGNYEKMLDQLTTDRIFDEQSLLTLTAQKDSLTNLNAKYHEHIEHLSAQLTPETFSFRKIDPNALKQAEMKLVDHNVKLSIRTQALKDIEAELALTDTLKLSYNIDDIRINAERFRALEHALFSLQAGVKEHKRHVSDRKKQSALLEQVPCGDQFPGCQFLVNAFKAKEELPKHEQEVVDAEIEANNVSDEIKSLSKFNDMLSEFNKLESTCDELTYKIQLGKLEVDKLVLTIDKMQTELDTAKLEMERYEQSKRDLEKNDVISSEIAKARQQLSQQEVELRDVEKKLVSLHQQAGARENDISRLNKQIATTNEVKETCTAYEHYVDAMGKDGIALQVLTQKLPLINEEINKILSSSTEFGVFIEYDVKDQSIRLYLQYGQYKSRLLELGSGAEKFLASVAIRSALLSISNLPRSNMFIIDEGFGKLDPNNLEAVQRMFDYLKSVFDHVIVISHSELMKDMVDNMIDITADDENYAHVEIGG
jgi:DNA repair exonuclease SbcCD ATPase subunit/DNA repair exonuclease SbcCD nuclease subunit